MSREARERVLTFLLWVGVVSLVVMAGASLVVVGIVAELVAR